MPLTAANFRREVLDSKQPVCVEFTAEWCGSSHIMAPAMREIAIRFKDDVKFCRLNVDEYQDIAREYAVQRIPTILLFLNSQVVDSMSGALPKKILTQKLKGLIQEHNGDYDAK
ncbi:MAG: thioredoxin [Gemmatimonadota bacterium]|nr:MAG: thioredoxin [Gemmatimonadota bacterium]